MTTTLQHLRDLVERTKNEDGETPVMVNISTVEGEPCFRHLSGRGIVEEVEHGTHGDLADVMSGDEIVSFGVSEG